MNIQWKPVSNYWQGRSGYKPEAIVIHIAEGWLNGAYSWFNTPSAQASAHFMIGKNGDVWQFVHEHNTAWHAGGPANATWSLLKNNVNPNLYTIGIEHEGFTGEVWTDAMYNASAELITILSKNFSIPIDRNHIIGHNEINSISRSRCPGNGMDFNKLINLAINKLEDPKMIAELKSQIQTLTNQNNDLKNQLNSLNSKITTLNNEKASLNAKVTTLTNERTSLNSRLTSLENQIEELIKSKDVNDTIKSQNSILRSEVKKLQEANAKINRDMDTLRDKNRVLQEVVDSKASGRSILDYLKGIFK